MRVARYYQTDCFEAIRHAFRVKGLKRVIAELATGLGKTVIFTLITFMARERGGRVLILVNRDVLIGQAIQELAWNGIHAQREQAKERSSVMADVVVGSIQSMQGRWLERWPKNYFRLVILDECHGSGARTFQNILSHFGDAFHLGVTATVERHDKKGLWKGYEEIVYRMPLRGFTQKDGTRIVGGVDDGWLCDFDFQELPVPIVLDDAIALGKTISEAEELLEFEKNNYLPRLFAELSESAQGFKGIAFLPGCSASDRCAKEMQKRGVDARHIEGRMKKTDREGLFAWFKQTKTGILVCADLLSVGYNQPDVNWLGMCRIVRSEALYKQRLGRGTRPVCDVDSCQTREERLAMIAASDKPNCRVVDLMIQNENHNLCTPSCLITEDLAERQLLDKERSLSQRNLQLEEYESILKAKRIEAENKQLETLANDAANGAEKRRNHEKPFTGHILKHYPMAGMRPASEAQKRFMADLGYDGPMEVGENPLTSQQAKRIIDVFIQHKKTHA